jgi:hypothetical protein
MLKTVFAAVGLLAAASSLSAAQEYRYLIGRPAPNGAAMPPGVSAACLAQGGQYVVRFTNTSGRAVKCLWTCIGMLPNGADASFKWTDTPRLVPPGGGAVTYKGQERVANIRFRTNASCVYAPD